MSSPVIDRCRKLLAAIDGNPEALLFLVSGAIDGLNRIEEGQYTKYFEESWQSLPVNESDVTH